MPNSNPYISPTSVSFFSSECPQTEKFCIFNPFYHDILFKVDNAYPKKYKVSHTQGVVSSRQKLTVELTCTSGEPSQDGVQVRFFKWARPRLGQKPHAQRYVGYREIKILVTTDRSERERTPSDTGSVPVSAISGPEDEHHPATSVVSSGSRNSSTNNPETGGRRIQVLTNIFLIIFLVVCGLTLNQVNETWFSTNIFDGVRPQSLAVASYTLACVIGMKLLTLR